MADQTTSFSQTGNGKSGPPLWLRVTIGAIASGVTGWGLNWFSLHGVDFKVLGIDSEFIKSTIETLLTTVIFYPECIPLTIAAAILFVRKGARVVMNAFTEQLPPDKE